MLRPKTGSRSGMQVLVAPERSSDFELFDQKLFLKLLSMERKRTERSQRRFVLMLLDLGTLLKTQGQDKVMGKILAALAHATRDTDFTGWYEAGSVIGVIFTEI